MATIINFHIRGYKSHEYWAYKIPQNGSIIPAPCSSFQAHILAFPLLQDPMVRSTK